MAAKNKEGLQWKHRYYIALGAGKALRYLHEECRVGCIVHRDMRPNNILLTHDFIPMIGDFGLARRQSSREKAEETQVIGTMGYVTLLRKFL
jgi:serine/threonine protein kinase